MAQLDDDVGSVMQNLKDIGLDDNTIVVFTTDNGTETLHLARWRARHRLPAAKGRSWKAASACPCILRWPGHVPADSVQNGIFSGLDWFPTFLAAAGNPNITDQLLKGVETRRPDLQEPSRRLQPDGRHHRQGSVRAPRDLLPRREHGRARCALTTTSIVSSTSPAAGSVRRHRWTCPILINLRLDPFERQGWPMARTNGAHRLLRLVQVPILALCVRPAGVGQGTPDLPRLPADAGGREFQPSTPSKPRWRRRWRQAKRRRGTANNTNDLHGGRLARAARLFINHADHFDHGNARRIRS